MIGAAITAKGKRSQKRDEGTALLAVTGAGNVWRELLALALPILGSIALQLIEGALNAMWVGRYLGEAALAGVSNANIVLILLAASAFGVWMALTIRVGYHLGARRFEDARRNVRAAGWLFVGGGIVLVVVLETFSRPLLQVLAVPPEFLRQAQEYLQVILVSVPITYLYGVVIAVLRGANDARSGFLFSLMAAVLDAGLNPLFIFGLGPVPRGGVAGSAWATVFAQAGSLSALLLFLYRRDHFLCLRRGELTMQGADWRVAGKLIKLGGPIGLDHLWKSVLAILMISLVNRFGVDVTAAYGAMIQLWTFLMMPSMAVSLAATALAAQSLGAARWDRVSVITRLSVSYSLLATGLLLLLLEGMDRSAVVFLPPGSPALIVASQINREASWCWLLMAGCSGLMATPRAAGAVWGPLAVSALSVGSRFPIAELLRQQLAAQGIWWSFPISGVVTAIATAIYYHRGKWRRAAQSVEEPTEGCPVIDSALSR